MPWKPLIAAVLISLAFPPPCGAQGNVSPESSAAVREKAIEALIQGDYERSLEILEPLAHAGDPIAQYVMGYAHEEGLGREPDLEAAVRWYKRAAEGGHLEAMVRLGEMYALGYGVDAQNEELAVRYVARAATYGYPLAQHFLGMFNLWGTLGVARDVPAALSFFNLAADQGFAPSTSIKGAIEMTDIQREALAAEMNETRDRYAANQVMDFETQQACLDELKDWSFQAASLFFGLVVVEEREDYFFAALVGGGAPFSPLGESYWECDDGRLRLWH